MGPSGYITEIERYSIHDGPGIRSVVFLKGCQLRCAWCCNPETLASFPEMSFVREKCIRCMKCVEGCPHGAITVDASGDLATNRQVCSARCYGTTDSFGCTRRCFSGARRTIGQRMTVEAVVAEVEKDHPLYERTGGGVTLSGGEVSFQPEFALGLLKRMKENWIDTAIETNGSGQNGFLERISPYVDFFFLDIKSLNNEKHLRWTGGSNKSSLNTALKLTKGAKQGLFSLVIRTPVIPGLNDTPEDLREIGAFIKNNLENVPKWELLPFHRLGRGKYASMGMEYLMDEVEPLSPQRMKELETGVQDVGVLMIRF